MNQAIAAGAAAIRNARQRRAPVGRDRHGWPEPGASVLLILGAINHGRAGIDWAVAVFFLGLRFGGFGIDWRRCAGIGGSRHFLRCAGISGWRNSLRCAGINGWRHFLWCAGIGGSRRFLRRARVGRSGPLRRTWIDGFGLGRARGRARIDRLSVYLGDATKWVQRRRQRHHRRERERKSRQLAQPGGAGFVVDLLHRQSPGAGEDGRCQSAQVMLGLARPVRVNHHVPPMAPARMARMTHAGIPNSASSVCASGPAAASSRGVMGV